MKKSIMLFTAFLLMFSTTVLTAKDTLLQPAAVVNLVRPQMISIQQVNETFEEYRQNMQRQGQQIQETREDILEVLIENELLIQGARQFGVTVSDQEIQSELNEQRRSVEQQLGQNLNDQQFTQILDQYFGKTLEGFRQEIRNKILVEKYVLRAKRAMIENVSAPTQQEIRTVYRQNATNFINPEMTNIRHIFVDNRNKSDQDALEKINRALNRLQSGEKSFSELVLEISEDEATKFSGGELGWLAINDSDRSQMLGGNFFDSVFALNTGDVSEVIESNAGYHVVEVLEHRDPRVLGLDDPINPSTRTTVSQYISNQMYVQRQSEAFNRAINELVKELKAEADIRILL